MSDLLARANADVTVARLLLSPAGNPTNDEMITDQAAYHVQQAIEKALKYQIEISGLPYRKIHNLVGLISDAEKTGLPVSDELKSMAFQISDWEASSRYNDEFSVVKSDIEKAIRIYEELESSILTILEQAIHRE